MLEQAVNFVFASTEFSMYRGGYASGCDFAYGLAEGPFVNIPN